MKKYVSVFIMLFFISDCFSQTTLSAKEAAKHVGEKATVCDKVFSARFFEGGTDQPTLVNMGDAYPNNPFTFVIKGDDRKKFSYRPEEFLVNKQVCVSGEIKDYKGKPEMIVSDSVQVVIK